MWATELESEKSENLGFNKHPFHTNKLEISVWENVESQWMKNKEACPPILDTPELIKRVSSTPISPISGGK